MREHRDEIMSRDATIEQLHITIEDLTSQVEDYDRSKEEAAKESGILGKLQGAVN